MSPITLGHKLAYLANEKMIDNDLKLKLSSLLIRSQEINSKKKIGTIWGTIPNCECHSEKAYLDGNEDFFMALILVDPNKANSNNHCQRLSKHLNDCYHCFEIFCQVLSDYYKKCIELTQ